MTAKINSNMKITETAKTVLYIVMAVMSIVGASASIIITYNKVSEHDETFVEISQQLSDLDEKIEELEDSETIEIKALLMAINKLSAKTDVLSTKIDNLSRENKGLKEEVRELRNAPNP